MKRHARSSYEPGEQTLTLYEAPKAKRGGVFETPEVRPGRYMVQIFDGTEAGTHYTWGFFTVANTSLLPRTGVPASYWNAALLIGLGLVLVIASLRGAGNASKGTPKAQRRLRSFSGNRAALTPEGPA